MHPRKRHVEVLIQLCKPDNANICHDALAEVALVGGQIPEARVSRANLLCREKSQRLIRNDCSPELEVPVHPRHLVALVYVLESLEERRLVATILRCEEELIFAVVEFGPDVQGL